jgi:hypothetical protein
MAMSFLKKFGNLFKPTSPKKTVDYSIWINVKCNRCGETIPCRIDLRSDLYIEYGENPSDVTYSCHKLIMGEKRCYQNIEVDMQFDKNRKKIISRQITGGEFVN